MPSHSCQTLCKVSTVVNYLLPVSYMLTVRKKALAVSVAALATGGAYVLTDDKRRREAQLTLASTYRVMNLASTVAIMCGDYGIDSMYRSKAKASEYDAKYKELCQLQSDLEELHRQQFDQFEINKAKGSTPSADPWLIKIDENAKVMDKVALELVALSEQKEHVRHDLHQRNAKRLTQMCSENGGLYIKLGQHIAMLDYIVPIEYQTELFSLLGTTPQSSIDSVRSVIKSELGAYPDELYDTFDPVPIASASLAQVHIATKNGVKYAVKVQHDGLAESAAFDMLVITNLVALVPHIFKEFNYNWLSAEMNRNVPLELDFRVERENILKTTKMLKKYIESGKHLALFLPCSLNLAWRSMLRTNCWYFTSYHLSLFCNSYRCILKSLIQVRSLFLRYWTRSLPPRSSQ